jgi:hypothetical protein
MVDDLQATFDANIQLDLHLLTSLLSGNDR